MAERGIQKIPIKGAGALVVTLAVVVVALVFVPTLRVFLLISIPLGVFIAVALYFWHKHAPVREPEEKRKIFHLDDK